MSFDLHDVFGFSMSPLEIVLRGTAMFWFLFLIFRFVLRRDVGSLGVGDFVFVVILGDASQNAMIGSGTSASDGMLLIATLVGWNVFVDWLAFRFRAVERVIQPSRLCLVRDGQMQRRAMRREFISVEELMSKIRSEGIDDVRKIKRMYLEGSGELSVVKIKD
jgi:uncharacterized membrane protein YcaP (DUF421 family)